MVDNSILHMLKLRQRKVNILSKDTQLIKDEPESHIYIFRSSKSSIYSFTLPHIASTLLFLSFLICEMKTLTKWSFMSFSTLIIFEFLWP